MTWTMSDAAALLLSAGVAPELAYLALCLSGSFLERKMSTERLDKVLRVSTFSGLILAPALAAFSLTAGGPRAPWPLWVILVSVWLAGALYHGVFRHLGKARLLRRVERVSEPCGDRELVDLKEGIAAWLDVKGGVTVYSGGLIPTPYTRGFFKKKIYISDVDCTSDEWKLLLTHELIHCRRNDCFYRRALLILQALFWFCPHVARFADYAIEVNEMSCDEYVIRERPRGARAPYCRLLVRMREDTCALLGAYLCGDEDGLERRLCRLARIHKEECPALSALLATGAALLVPAMTVFTSLLASQCL